MTRAFHGVAALIPLPLGLTLLLAPARPVPAADEPPPPPKAADPALAGSAIAAVVAANGGKPPATGEELVKGLGKLGKFAQLPVVFSAVRLDSGLGNPRVVIAPLGTGLSDANATETNLTGRLFLAANLEKDAKGGDPRVVSVEFISWNTLRRKFDFGVIEDVGGDGEPQLKVLDGGKCFSCHKNKGPILGASPWTNTTNLPHLQNLVANRLRVVASVPAGGAPGVRDRIDGLALAAPQAEAVDAAVRIGALLRLDRETFQLMNRSAGGRKAFVALLLAVAEPGVLDPNDRETRRLVDAWGNDQSYLKFAADWVAVARATNTGILADFAAFPVLPVSPWAARTLQPVPQPPVGGFRSASEAQEFETRVRGVVAQNESVLKNIAAQSKLIADYDAARAQGRHAMPAAYQPSNPKAFAQPVLKAAQKPSGMVNPLMLAGTIGLTDGDRHFLARSLAEAAERVKKPKVTAATLARAVFEGPEFADVLAGGPLPDRDEFKDRFVAGLDGVLTKQYGLARGFAPDRAEYASGPRFDPKAAEEKEAVVVPTSACLRCHDVRPAAGKPRLFESIPALAFDPLDEAGRAAWVKAAGKERQRVVLARMLERLAKDADMPPHDSPEHDLFRVKQAAAFTAAKHFLEAELARAKKN